MNGNLTLTLSDCKALLGHYEAMAAAAGENDWDRLAERGLQASRLREEIAARRTIAVPSESEQQEIRALVERILFLDGEVRSHANPALESIRKMLSGAVRGRVVHTAYGAHGP